MEPQAEDLHRILTTIQSIASVGVSSNTNKESHWIVDYLAFQGYTVFPVNPTAERILDRKSYPDLASVPEAPDVVQVFRKPEDVPPVVEDAISRGAKVIWMQEGIVNLQAAEMARAAGLEVVMNTCMRAAHQVLIGDQKGWLEHIQQDERFQAFIRQLGEG